MGRRRSTNHGLPPHMARKGQSYYYVTNDKPRRWISLGRDLAIALAAWARHEGQPIPDTARTLTQVGVLYMIEVNKGTFNNSPRTKKDKAKDLARLEKVFGDSPIETIAPVDVATYLEGRQVERGKRKGELAKTRANREISLLSHLVNWARRRGITGMSNPSAGVDKHAEPGRGRYLDDAEFDAIYAAGDELLRDAMDLLSSTSQRPGDIVKMKRASIRGGALWGRQDKTGTPQRFEMVGDLKAAVDRMVGRSRDAESVYLVADSEGQPLTYWMLEDRWSAARAMAAKEMPSVADAQMRDIRGKTATDLEDLAHAQALLGHKSRAMTERYVKQRAGTKVTPHNRKRAKSI